MTSAYGCGASSFGLLGLVCFCKLIVICLKALLLSLMNNASDNFSKSSSVTTFPLL